VPLIERLRSRIPDQRLASVRDRVIKAREIQSVRFNGQSADTPVRNSTASKAGIYSNSAMSTKEIRTHCALDTQSEDLLENAMLRQGLSARAHDRILKVSRTIADLDASEQIQSPHISEAINYRSLDRNYWM